MSGERTPVIAGNWKMNGLMQDGVALAADVAAAKIKASIAKHRTADGVRVTRTVGRTLLCTAEYFLVEKFGVTFARTTQSMAFLPHHSHQYAPGTPIGNLKVEMDKP